jgi:hypothetical protein
MVERAADGILRTFPIETPIITRQENGGTDFPEWEQWLRDQLDIERDENGAKFADIGEALEFTRGDLLKGMERLERQVAELRGGLDVMRSLGRVGLRLRGDYDRTADYLAHDVVAHEGSSFIARRDKPGTCPGEDWQVLASKGHRGPAGPLGRRGVTGGRGAPAPTIKTWIVNTQKFEISPVLSDGTVGTACELRGLFQAFLDATTAAE